MNTQARWNAAAGGVAAGLATLGVGELLAGIWTRAPGSAGIPSPLFALGAAFIDLTPSWLKDFAVAVFGTADKIALGVGMAIVSLLCFGLIGLLVRRWPGVATAGVLGLGFLAAAAVLTRPGAQPLDAIPALGATAVGLWLLGRFARQAQASTDPRSAGGARSRRQFLTGAAITGAIGVAGVALGRVVSAVGTSVEEAVRNFPLPRAKRPVTLPAGIDTGIPGHSTYLTPNANFYRIDTALGVPNVDLAGWRLRVTGLVERELELTYAELLAEDMVEAVVTLTCVSNEVGGSLAGNATWLGWPVRHLLARAGVKPEADMVLSTSADGWTAGTPIQAMTDQRDALLAVAMNGEALPREHGFPVRLVVPGLYGYVSATKWLTELKLTRFDADQGYWTPRGWAALGPIKTASRIDLPREGARVAAGTVTVAGVAWAQHRGVSRVEVRVDDGKWSEAKLRPEPSTDAWRLWTWDWVNATPGKHVLSVRATDGSGEVQTEAMAAPAPDGASGWHRVSVQVS